MMTAFWSIQHGQACTTSNTAAVACMSAILKKGKLLAAHTHISRSPLEKCLFPSRELAGHDSGDFANHGLDALLRLSRSGRLSSGMVPDYTWSLLRENRLDVLPGTQRPSRVDGPDADQILQVFQAAVRHYGHVMVDVHSGLEVEGTLDILTAADRLMVCLNQNSHMLESWFSDRNTRSKLENHSACFLISRYDRDVGLTPANIARKYGVPRTRVLPVPYSAALMHACNQGNLYDFLARHAADVKSPERDLMDSLKEVVELLNEGGES